jgi:hypothetical protein
MKSPLFSIGQYTKISFVNPHDKLRQEIAMGKHTLDRLPQFLHILGLDEVPMGIFYTDTKPTDEFSSKPNDLPTRKIDLGK